MRGKRPVTSSLDKHADLCSPPCQAFSGATNAFPMETDHRKESARGEGLGLKAESLTICPPVSDTSAGLTN